MQTLEGRMQTGGNPQSGAASAASSGGQAGRPLTWNATFVEAKGWVTAPWGDQAARTAQMLTPSDQQILIGNMKKLLDEDVRALIDDDATLRANGNRPMYASARIKFVPHAERSVLWEAKKTWEQAWSAGNQVFFQGMDMQPSLMRFVIESAPWKKVHLQMAACFHEVWRQNGDSNIQIRAETGPPFTRMWTQPADHTKRAVQLYQYSDKAGWVLFEAELKSICPMLDVAKFHAALKQQY